MGTGRCCLSHQGRISTNIGTKSLLFGAHQFILHPLFVFWGWWKLYGFPYDPRLWLAFIIHDWGYWGCPNMDGPEGKCHPYWAAMVMARWFGDEWGDECRLHSRTIAKHDFMPPSRLCAADKMVTSLTPAWLYLPMVRMTGELAEYMEQCSTTQWLELDPGQWYDLLGERTRAWAERFANGKRNLPDPGRNATKANGEMIWKTQTQ